MTDDDLEQKLGYRFVQRGVLRQALTHRSRGAPNNERLEFLGDGALNFIVASLLYERFSSLSEGELSRARAYLVREETLLQIALELDLGSRMLLGEGELKSGGFRRPSMLADTLEAVLGAVYLDGGFTAAEQVVQRLYDSIIKSLDPLHLYKDPKTRLQEYLQARKLPLPVYTVLATSGAAHAQKFEIECNIAALEVSARGQGGSRRVAEQQAAERAYAQLETAARPASA